MSFKSEFRSRISGIKKKIPNKKNLIDSKRVEKADFHLPIINSESKQILTNNEANIEISDNFNLNPKKRPITVDQIESNKDFGINEPAPENHITKREAIIYSELTEPLEILENRPSHPTNPLTSMGIPEGFFDDPEMDAKARNVPYINKEEEIYEQFKEEIKEFIRDTDKAADTRWEESDISRDQYELDCMKQCVDRMFYLRNQVETVKEIGPMEQVACGVDTQPEIDDASSDSDHSISGLFGWRSKNPNIM